MKKKNILFFVLLPLLCVAAFIVYCYIYAATDSNKKYYFPQIETYLKVYKPPFKEYGYIIWSKDSNLSFSDTIDFVKIKKTETSWVSFIVNPLENNKIFVVDRFNNAVKINQVRFVLEKISREDTTFFEKHIVAGTHTYQTKLPYIEISVEGFLQSVFFTDIEPIKAEPIGN